MAGKHCNETNEQVLRGIFQKFIDASLHSRFEEALLFLDESFIGVGELGVLQNKKQAELAWHEVHQRAKNATIEYEIKNISVKILTDDVAVMFGEIDIVRRSESGESMCSGLMQTVGVRYNGNSWKIEFTHASPTILTVEQKTNIICSTDNTSDITETRLQPDTVLCAEINLTKNIVVRLECKDYEWAKKLTAATMEELVCGAVNGELSEVVEQEYYAFWNRSRLLRMFEEDVKKDYFDYRKNIGQGFVWLRSAVEMVRQTCSNDIMAVVSYFSLDNQKLELEHFTHKAFHDALTGILNREGFENRVDKLLQDYQPQNNTVLFMIDLDDFKHINDRLGHQTGDTVLRQVASVLKNTFGDYDTVGRMGGDEFMVLLTGAFSPTFIEKKAGELLQSMRLQMGGDKHIPVSVSIGVVYGRARITFERMYHLADIALYTAKKAGKSCYHIINSDTNIEQSSSLEQTNLFSLQTLLNYTDGEKIIQSKTPYEAMLESIPGGVIVIEVTDSTVKFTTCNGWIYDFLGCSEEEVFRQQCKDPFAFIHPEDVYIVRDIVEEIRGGLDSFNIVYRVSYHDRKYRHISMVASTTERKQGSVIMYGISTDVEEITQLKKALERKHTQLSTLLNTIPGGVIIISLTDKVEITQANSWIHRFLGYSWDETITIEKENPFAFVHPEDLPLVWGVVKQMRAGVKNISAIYRLLNRAGNYQYVSNNASLVEYNPDKIIYYGIVTDMREFVDMKTKLEYSSKQLEALLNTIPEKCLVEE